MIANAVVRHLVVQLFQSEIINSIKKVAIGGDNRTIFMSESSLDTSKSVAFIKLLSSALIVIAFISISRMFLFWI